jgi:hypothetical protein
MPGLPWFLAQVEDLVDVPAAATVPMVVVPEPPAVTMHVGIEVEVTVVAVPAIAVGIRVAGRRQGCRTEREDAGESEHCSTGEHGRSFLQLRVCPSAQLVGEPLRCVQVVDSFNVVQPTFIDAVFVRRSLLIQSRSQTNSLRAKNKEPRTMPGL